MSLPLPLAEAAHLFIEKFIAYDVTSVLVDGRWEETIEPDRIINGVIQTQNSREIELDSDGAIADGTMLLHTKSIIYAYDLSFDTGEETKQTYIRYKSNVWKLQQRDNWTVKCQGFNQYILIRYTKLS